MSLYDPPSDDDTDPDDTDLLPPDDGFEEPHIRGE